MVYSHVSWSCIGVLLTATYEFIIKSTNTLEDAYDMGASYVLLLSTLIVLDFAFRSRKLVPIIASIVGVLYAFATGTRGPIVIIGVFIAIQLLYLINARSKHKIRNTIVAGTCLFALMSTVFANCWKSIPKQRYSVLV